MASWGAQRQILILLVFFALVIGAFSGIYVLYFKPQPTCFDGLQNQGELGVDCGGGCSAVCVSEVTPLVTFWTRLFEVTDKAYDVAAFVENPNAGYGVPSLRYTFRVFDANNVIIVEREGETFVNEKDRFVIVEARLDVGNRIPARAIVEFDDIVWKRLPRDDARQNPRPFSLEDKQLVLEPHPRLSAKLVNMAAVPLKNISVSAVVLDRDDNALGVSSTVVDLLPRGGAADIAFTWPQAFNGTPVSTEIYPHLNVVAP